MSTVDSVLFIPTALTPEILPGKLLMRRVGEYEVLLCKFGDSYYAIENRCSHMGKPLVNGRLLGSSITCPVHSASFDVRNGNALGFPATRAIRRFRIHVDGDVLSVANRPE